MPKDVPQFDLDDPARNMFGVLPCPDCGSRFRWPTQPIHPTHPNVILCDDCGRAEPYDLARRAAEESPADDGEA